MTRLRLTRFSWAFWIAIIVLQLSAPVVFAEIRVALSASSDAENSGTYVWAQAFANELEREGIASSIYPSSSLGNEVLRAEQVMLGLLEVNVCGTQEVELFTELMEAIELPFLFRGNAEMDRLIDETDFLMCVNERAVAYGMRVVDFAYLGGMSGLFTARAPIRTVDDVKSFRMRAMVSEQLAYFEAWGGSGAQVAWEEVPQALQTGIVDGYMNPPIVAVLFGHGGQLDYFTDIRISPAMRVVTISEAWYQGLDSQAKDIVDQAIRVARIANRTWTLTSEERDFRSLESVGIEVVHLSQEDREAFQQKLLPLYPTQATEEGLKRMLAYVDKLRATE